MGGTCNLFRSNRLRFSRHQHSAWPQTVTVSSSSFSACECLAFVFKIGSKSCSSLSAQVGILSHDTLLGPKPTKLVRLVAALVRSDWLSRKGNRDQHQHSKFDRIGFVIEILTLVKQPLCAFTSSLAIAKVDANNFVVRWESVLGTLGRELFVNQLWLVRVVRHGSHRCDAL